MNISNCDIKVLHVDLSLGILGWGRVALIHIREFVMERYVHTELKFNEVLCATYGWFHVLILSSWYGVPIKYLCVPIVP